NEPIIDDLFEIDLVDARILRFEQTLHVAHSVERQNRAFLPAYPGVRWDESSCQVTYAKRVQNVS
ncbi:MAG TPA: hypothetical protein VGH22_02865, partial [Candidatus Binatia bacterium]